MRGQPQKHNRPPSDISPRAYRWAMVAILLLAIALRVYHLAADLPMDVSLSQGATTDGPSTVIAGRNMALFGDWNPHGDVRNPLHLYPAMSWASYGLFSLLGVGFWQANLVTVIAGLLAIVFTAAFAREQFGRRAALLAALFMASDYLYVMYSRTPVAYVPLTLGWVLSLYTWQRGLRRPGWFALSGMVLGLSIWFIKILGFALLPSLVAGLLILAWRRWRTNQPHALKPLLLFGLGLLVSTILWFFLIYIPESQVVGRHLTNNVHTFSPSEGLVENIRFALQSVLQFSVRSGYFLRMLPLFAIVYLYLLVRGLQMLSSGRPRLAMGEILALLSLVSVALALLASANRPTRYMITLVPTLSLVGGLALDKAVRARNLRWPTKISRWLPIVLMFGLTYFYYQILGAMTKFIDLIRFRTNLVDSRVVASGGTLFILLGAALVLAMLSSLVTLWLMQRSPGHGIALPSRRARSWVVTGFVVCNVLISLGSYVWWGRAPEFSMVEASRQIRTDLDEDAILGGPYAYTLVLENDLPAVRFQPVVPYEVISSMRFTHLLAESDSPLDNGPFNDERFHTDYPQLMQRATLVKSYYLRGYEVKVYAIEQEP